MNLDPVITETMSGTVPSRLTWLPRLKHVNVALVYKIFNLPLCVAMAGVGFVVGVRGWGVARATSLACFCDCRLATLAIFSRYQIYLVDREPAGHFGEYRPDSCQKNLKPRGVSWIWRNIPSFAFVFKLISFMYYYPQLYSHFTIYCY